MYSYNSVYVVEKVHAYLTCIRGVFESTSAWAWQLLPEVVCYHEYMDAVDAVRWIELGQMLWPLN